MLKDYFKNIFKNKYFVFFFVFVVYSFLSVLWAKDKGAAVNQLKNYIIIYALVTVFIRENRNAEEIKKSVKFFLWLSIGIVAVSLVQIAGINLKLPNHFTDSKVSLVDFPHIKQVPQAFFYNPNNYSLWLGIVLLAAFVTIMYSSSKKEKAAYTGFYIVTLTVSIFAMSRTMWITANLVYGFFFIFFIINRQWNKLKKVAVFGLLTITIFVGLAQLPAMGPFYGKIAKTPGMEFLGEGEEVELEVGKGGSVNLRYTLMYNTIDAVITNRHYLGLGAGNMAVWNKEMKNTNKVYSSHSLWFELLGDFGIVIFAYVIIMYIHMSADIYKIFKKGQGDVRKYALFFGGCAFEMVLLVFSPSSVINFPPFWVILALIFAFNIRALKDI